MLNVFISVYNVLWCQEIAKKKSPPYHDVFTLSFIVVPLAHILGYVHKGCGSL